MRHLLSGSLPLLTGVSLSLLILLACQPGQDQKPPAEGDSSTSGAVAEPDSSEQGQPAQGSTFGTSVFTCAPDDTGSFSFTITDFNMYPGKLALWLPQGFGRPYEVLVREEGAQEPRFTGNGILLEPSANTATLTVDDRAFQECTKDHRASIWEHAKLTGVDFRATGNEPGWHLEIRADLEARSGTRILFVYDYGERNAVLLAPDPETEPEARRTVYRGENGDLRIVVEIEGIPCQDSMSGEEFESTVTVQFQERTYRGCGRALH